MGRRGATHRDARRLHGACREPRDAAALDSTIGVTVTRHDIALDFFTNNERAVTISNHLDPRQPDAIDLTVDRPGGPRGHDPPR